MIVSNLTKESLYCCTICIIYLAFILGVHHELANNRNKSFRNLPLFGIVVCTKLELGKSASARQSTECRLP